MYNVVYVDVLFAVNLVINYFVLLGVCKIMHHPGKRIRLLLGSALGALYAVLMFFPELSFLYSAVLKLILSITIVFASFKFSGIQAYFKLFLCFYIVSVAFGGMMFALWYFVAPPGLNLRNGVVYLNISPIVLILASVFCYIIISVFSRIFHRSAATKSCYRIVIRISGEETEAEGLLDTGNELVDTLSGLPVVIIEYRQVEKIIPNRLRDTFKSGVTEDYTGIEGVWKSRFHMVPYGSVAGNGGLLPAFRPDELIVSGNGIHTDRVLVAVTNKRLSNDGRYTALLNPHLFLEAKPAEQRLGALKY